MLAALGRVTRTRPTGKDRDTKLYSQTTANKASCPSASPTQPKAAESRTGDRREYKNERTKEKARKDEQLSR